jgi:RimJ/RimL family protein N-acetyltransferase
MGLETPAAVQIVPIAEQYIESYHACLDSVARERLYLAFVEAPPIESTLRFVRYNIANDVPQFVGLVGDVVVGWCDVSPARLEGFTHCGALGMGVHKDFRGQGIGYCLVKRTLARAAERGLERIELEVLASNLPAIRLYEKVGFHVEGVKRMARKIDGQYDDLIEMALFVAGDLSAAPNHRDLKTCGE